MEYCKKKKKKGTKSLEVTYPRHPLSLESDFAKRFKNKQRALHSVTHFVVGLNSDGKRDSAAYLHFKASQRHTVH